MYSVLETSIFTRRADALLTREERAELIGLLARTPQVGDAIPGLGGIASCASRRTARASAAPPG